MCRHLQYKGLWPVIYKSDDGLMYKKDCMACTEAERGICKLGKECEVFKIAADEMEKHWQLRYKKMG